MSATCDAMAIAIEKSNVSAFMEADIAFHSALLEGSGNRIFAQLSDAIVAVLRAREVLELLPECLTATVCSDHRRVVQAIEAKDGVAAENAMRDILRQAGDEIFGEHADAPGRP
jgi:DNA-binding FadR family transcriptional regulator